MEKAAPAPNQRLESLRDQVRNAVIWRSGTQVFGQILTWASTFIVIRVLSPSDYGLFAMTSVVLVLLSLVNGYSLANAVIQRPQADRRLFAQLFGMLWVLNLGLVAAQWLLAPLAAAYYRQPIVADLLRVQSLLYLTTPFIALAYAKLAREMDFRKQAQVNLVSALAGAAASLAGALGGLGVWTLVLAPVVLFGTRALGMTIAARTWMLPRFDFRGAGAIAQYGGVVVVGQVFWFIQTQADIFIAGRHFDPHALGIYTTALFLTQMFVTKFVPPLNEVAFSAYARIQDDKAAVASAFLKSVRVIFLVGLPFYAGFAVTAEPLVHTVLGEKWLETAPVVRLLAFAMPWMTLQVLFAPALEALGRPGLSTRNSVLGAIILPVAFYLGVQGGERGIALAWVAGYPLLVALSAIWTLPVLGVRLRDLAGALASPLFASVGMALVVLLVDSALPALAPPIRLAILVSTGGAIYGAWLLAFARPLVTELLSLIRRRAG